MGRREFHEGDEEEGGTDVCKGTEPGSAWVLPPTQAPHPMEKTEPTVQLKKKK